jgi:hypothetical protein
MTINNRNNNNNNNNNINSAILRISKDINTISFIGNVKGSGKTTAMRFFAKVFENMVLGITSVGVDGQRDFDNKAGTHLNIREGSIVATASALLPFMDATREILKVSDINTPLGEIVFVKARSDGNVLVAGPSTVSDLKKTREDLINEGAQLILIDGALNRKTIALTGEGVYTVFTFGVKNGKNVKNVEIQGVLSSILDEIFWLMLPLVGIDEENNNSIIVDLNEESMTVALNRELEKAETRLTSIHIKGAVTSGVIKEISEFSRIYKDKLKEAKFIIEDGTKILAKRKELLVFEEIMSKLLVENAINLLAICVNTEGLEFEEEDTKKLCNEILKETGIPVLDVKGGYFSC